MTNRSEVHGDAIGSSVGGGSLNINDITVYKNTVSNSVSSENDIEEKLVMARSAIQELEIAEEQREELLDSLSRITAELQTSQPNPERLRRFWDRIQENAPTVASILSSAASIAKLLGGG